VFAFFEQLLNSLQFGVTLFLLSAGLTLVFGVLNFINLAHGSMYMVGAFVGASTYFSTKSFSLAVLLGILSGVGTGLLLDLLVFRTLYKRDHLYQVLATFGLILFFNELVRIIWGPVPLFSEIPPLLNFRVSIGGSLEYPAYRIAIVVLGLVMAGALYVLIERTRFGMLVRAGASDREMLGALGVNIMHLYTAVICLGGALAAIAGVAAGPILAVQAGMGESILILVFVVIVIGGVGSITGAFFGALLVGTIDTLGRAFLRPLLGTFLPPDVADSAGPGAASMLIYAAMVIVLLIMPQGLFAGKQKQ
jgi:branched-chain amino acid transport system permease protein